MQFSKSLFFTSSIFSAGLAVAQDWGSFSGQVATIEHLIGNDYSLTSDLVIALNSSWSLVDIVGRREGQIANKSIVFNTADKKYYAKIAYTNTATSQTDDSLCFPAVPIRVSLDQDNNGGVQLRLIDGSFDIGCIEKTRVAGAVTTTESPGTIGTSSFTTSKAIETSTSTITESELNTLSTLSVPASTTSEASFSSSTVFELSTSTLSETPMSTVTFAASPISVDSTSTTVTETSSLVIETISSGSIEPTSTLASSSIFAVQTSSFVTFTTNSASAASASSTFNTHNVSASASPTGNGTFNGVGQSNTAAKMASIESTFYMGAFVALFLAATLA